MGNDCFPALQREYVFSNSARERLLVPVDTAIAQPWKGFDETDLPVRDRLPTRLAFTRKSALDRHVWQPPSALENQDRVEQALVLAKHLFPPSSFTDDEAVHRRI